MRVDLWDSERSRGPFCGILIVQGAPGDKFLWDSERRGAPDVWDSDRRGAPECGILIAEVPQSMRF